MNDGSRAWRGFQTTIRLISSWLICSATTMMVISHMHHHKHPPQRYHAPSPQSAADHVAFQVPSPRSNPIPITSTDPPSPATASFHTPTAESAFGSLRSPSPLAPHDMHTTVRDTTHDDAAPPLGDLQTAPVPSLLDAELVGVVGVGLVEQPLGLLDPVGLLDSMEPVEPLGLEQPSLEPVPIGPAPIASPVAVNLDVDLLMLDTWDDAAQGLPTDDRTAANHGAAEPWGVLQALSLDGPSTDATDPVVAYEPPATMDAHEPDQPRISLVQAAATDTAPAADDVARASSQPAASGVPEREQAPLRAHLAAFDQALERERALVTGSPVTGMQQGLRGSLKRIERKESPCQCPCVHALHAQHTSRWCRRTGQRGWGIGGLGQSAGGGDTGGHAAVEAGGVKVQLAGCRAV